MRVRSWWPPEVLVARGRGERTTRPEWVVSSGPYRSRDLVCELRRFGRAVRDLAGALTSILGQEDLLRFSGVGSGIGVRGR